MTAIKPGRNCRRSRGLTPPQEVALRTLLRRSTCSEPWVDDQIVTRITPGTGGRLVTLRLHDPSVFPPGGRLGTRMKWCRHCGRYTPAPAVQLIEYRRTRSGPVFAATLQCDDCRIADDAERYRELYEAGLHLRPAGSTSFVGMAQLKKRLRDRSE